MAGKKWCCNRRKQQRHSTSTEGRSRSICKNERHFKKFAVDANPSTHSSHFIFSVIPESQICFASKNGVLPPFVPPPFSSFNSQLLFAPAAPPPPFPDPPPASRHHRSPTTIPPSNICRTTMCCHCWFFLLRPPASASFSHPPHCSPPHRHFCVVVCVCFAVRVCDGFPPPLSVLLLPLPFPSMMSSTAAAAAAVVVVVPTTPFHTLGAMQPP